MHFMSAANLQQSMVSKKRTKKCFEDERKMNQSRTELQLIIYFFHEFFDFYGFQSVGFNWNRESKEFFENLCG